MREVLRGGRRSLADTFRHFDTDGDGTITRDELRLGLRKLRITATAEEVTDAIRKFSGSGGGKISNENDEQEEGRINLHQFLQMVEPSSSNRYYGPLGHHSQMRAIADELRILIRQRAAKTAREEMGISSLTGKSLSLSFLLCIIYSLTCFRSLSFSLSIYLYLSISISIFLCDTYSNFQTHERNWKQRKERKEWRRE